MSLLARDHEAGQIGVVSATSREQVARWGVTHIGPFGAAFTQSIPQPGQGELLLRRLEPRFFGLWYPTPRAVLRRVVSRERRRNPENLAWRQTGVMSADHVPPAVFTGSSNVDWAGHLTSPSGDVLVAGNGLTGEQALHDVMDAFEHGSSAPFTLRMANALAAIVLGGHDTAVATSGVVKIRRMLKGPGDDYHGRPPLDITVESSDSPEDFVEQLHKQYRIGRARALEDEGDVARKAGDYRAAMAKYDEAVGLYPESAELVMYWALTYIRAGELNDPRVLPALAWAFHEKPTLRTTAINVAHQAPDIGPEVVDVLSQLPASEAPPVLTTRAETIRILPRPLVSPSVETSVA